jgi:hypothetical protein
MVAQVGYSVAGQLRGRVLGGPMVERSGGVVYGLHLTYGD